MKKSVHILLFLLISGSSFSQISYAKKNVKKLSSKKMKGRGYVKKGELKAATYIAKEFKKHNLLAFTDDYFQYFKTSINTQPSKLKITINKNIKLRPGIDFLINPASPSLKGNFETILLTPIDLLNIKKLKAILKLAAGKILLIDTYNIDAFSKSEKENINELINFLVHSPKIESSATFIFTNDKLTWSGSTTQITNPSFTIKKQIDLKSISNITIETESVFYNNYQTQNIIGYIEGKSKTDSTIVLSAHYDHLGMMGRKTMFPGANDNASGIALLLDIAKYYAIKKSSGYI